MSSDDRTPPPRVTMIHRKNRLKAKAGGRPGGGPGRIDPKLMARAQGSVASMQIPFEDQAADELQRLRASAEKLRRLQGAERQAAIAQVRRIVHDLRGSGRTFNYDLLTRFADSCFKLVDRRETLTEAQVAVVVAHVDAMVAVMHNKIRGDGGAVGRELTKVLQIAIGRFKGEPQA